MVGEVGDDRMVDELESGTALLSTGGEDRPDALAPATAGFSSSSLGDLAVDGEEVLVVEVDLGRVEEVRRNWPFLRDRRVDAYVGLDRRFHQGEPWENKK